MGTWIKIFLDGLAIRVFWFIIFVIFCMIFEPFSSAKADTIFGIEVDKPINKQLADDPFVEWDDKGIKIPGNLPAIESITISLTSFDSEGNVYANIGKTGSNNIFAYSKAMNDQETCIKMAKKVIAQVPTTNHRIHHPWKKCMDWDGGFRFGLYIYKK